MALAWALTAVQLAPSSCAWPRLQYGNDRRCMGFTQMILICSVIVWNCAWTLAHHRCDLDFSAETLQQMTLFDSANTSATWKRDCYTTTSLGLQMMSFCAQLLVFELAQSLTGVVPSVHTYMSQFLDRRCYQWTLSQLDNFHLWIPLSLGHLDGRCIGMTQMLLTCITYVGVLALNTHRTSGTRGPLALTSWLPQTSDIEYNALHHCFHLLQAFGTLQLILLGIQLIAFLLWHSLTGVLTSVHTHMRSCFCRMLQIMHQMTWKCFQDVQFLLTGVVLCWFIAVRALCTDGIPGCPGRDEMPSGFLSNPNLFDWIFMFCAVQLTLMLVQLIALGIPWLLPDVGSLCSAPATVWTALCNFAQQSHSMLTWPLVTFNTLTSSAHVSGMTGRFRILMTSCHRRVWPLLTLLSKCMFSVHQYRCWHSIMLFVSMHYPYLEMHTIHWHDSCFICVMLPCICHMKHTDLNAYMEILTIHWLPRLDSFPMCSADDLSVLAAELSSMMCQTIHCFKARYGCNILQWCMLAVTLLTSSNMMSWPYENSTGLSSGHTFSGNFGRSWLLQQPNSWCFNCFHWSAIMQLVITSCTYLAMYTIHWHGTSIHCCLLLSCMYVRTMIHCLRDTCSCYIPTWYLLVVNLLTEIPYMVCQTIHSLSLHFALGPQMSFLLVQVQASTWFTLKPVPSPVVVPQKPKGLGAWLLRFRLKSLCWWWIWFWMFCSPLRADAPVFHPAANHATVQPTNENWHPRNNWGEGRLVCVDQSEAADDLHLQELINSFVVNSHVNGPPGPDKTRKRSWIRACLRALKDGHSWYRGQSLSRQQIPASLMPLLEAQMREQSLKADHGFGMTSKPPATNHNRKQTPSNRLLIMQWNAGGLSSSRYHELCHWLEIQQVSIALIQETRWHHTMEWQDSKWLGVHSGAAKESAGVMVLIRRTVISQTNLAWKEVVPGRVLHVRLHGRVRHYDLLNVYQYTSGKAHLDKRKWILAEVMRLIENLPRRNQFFMGGDFNCHLPKIPDLVGTESYVWEQERVRGTQHDDSKSLQNLVIRLRLVALNTWNPKLGPTFVRRAKVGSFHSRIDFGFMRVTAADGPAKQPVQLADFPMLSDTGHQALMFSVPRTWQAHKSATADARFTYQQRLHARCLRQTKDDRWTQYVSITQHCLSHLDLTAQEQHADDPLQPLHAIMADTFHCYLPKPSAVDQQERILPRSNVMTKWDHYKQLKQPTPLTMQSFFSCWKHWSRFTRLDKQQAKDLKLLKRQRLETLMRTAQQAADRHDLFGLRKILNQCCPKQRRVRFQLRHADGRLASPQEEFGLLCTYVQRTWSLQDEQEQVLPHILTHSPLSAMPFTEQELAEDLRHLNPLKAMAPPFTPAIAWATHADQLARIVYPLLEQWWLNTGIYIPPTWKSGWLTFVPKPQKTPTKAENLRPLALAEPVGKCVLGVISGKLMQLMLPTLVPWPQYAYLPGRSTLDALRRVTCHCYEVRALLEINRCRVHLESQGRTTPSCFGGVMIFLDLARAFDMLTRTRLFQALNNLQVPTDFQAILQAWHTNTDYVVMHHEYTQHVKTDRGIRQGCRAAPLLWTLFTVDLLRQLAQMTDMQWVQSVITLYADDFHAGQQINRLTDLDVYLQRVGLLMDLLEDAGLELSPGKSTALLKIAGKDHDHVQTQYTRSTKDGRVLLIPRRHGQYTQIPLKSNTKYLGAKMTYGNVADDTLQYRTSCSDTAFARLRRWLSRSSKLNLQTKHRLWHTVVMPVLHYGLLATNISQHGFTQLQSKMMTQLRIIAGNAAFHTGITHADLLQHLDWPNPAVLLLRSVRALRRRLADRQQILMPGDLLQTADWSHLQPLEHWLTQVMDAAPVIDSMPTEEYMLACPLCDKTFASSRALYTHMRVAHNHVDKGRRTPQPLTDAVQGLPTCSICGVSFSTWKRFYDHVATHRTLLQDSTDPLAHLRSWMNTPLGMRTATLLRQQQWDELKQDRELCTWLATHCVLCGSWTGTLHKSNFHLRSQHVNEITDLFSKASDLLLQITGRPPYDCPLCSKTVVQEHLCPVAQQLYLVKKYGLSAQAPVPDPAPAPPGRGYIAFLMPRDSVNATPECRHCHQTFETMPGLRLHINKGKCPSFDPQRPTVTKAADPMLIEALNNGHLWDYLLQPTIRMELTLRCQLCDVAYSTPAQLMLHIQTSHGQQQVQAQAWLGYLRRHLGPSTHCYCNPAPRELYSNHVCMPLRQIAMLFDKLQVEQKPAIFAPWTFDKAILCRNLHPALPVEFLERVVPYLVDRQFTALLDDAPTSGSGTNMPLLRSPILNS